MGIFDRFRKDQSSPTGPGGQLAPPPTSSSARPAIRATIPVGSRVDVVGESHYQDAIERAAGGRMREGVDVACLADLVPEPTNSYDPRAVMVLIHGAHVGYLSREEARSFRALIDQAISTHGRAVVEARIRGGWDRGRGDRGSFGVQLYFADRPEPTRAEEPLAPPVASPGPDEIRLRGSTTMSVSNEEHYQEALAAATGGAALAGRTYPVLADLVQVPASPHGKADAGPVLQATVGGRVVGFLTPAMSLRLDRLTARSRTESKRLTCGGMIFDGPKGLEVRLSACPHAADEMVVVDPYFEIITNLVGGRRSDVMHTMAEQLPDGSYRTRCGVTIKAAEARVAATTKPYVGDVDPVSHAIISIEGRCERC